MKAYDENGVCIHDIPDAPILTDMIYGGHVIWREAPNYISALEVGATDNDNTGTIVSTLQNVDLSAALPAGLTNARGILVQVQVSIIIPSNKTTATSYAQFWLNYSMVYNTTPGAYTFFGGQGIQSLVAGQEWSILNRTTAILPITYNGTTPYLTYQGTLYYFNLDTNVGNYYGKTWIYLLGVIV